MQVNAIISATANGKKISTTISHLRQSQESKATQLGTALNALTTNTYQGTTVNEIGVTDFTPEKQTPTIEVASKLRLDNNGYYIDITASNIPIGYIKLTGSYLYNQTKFGLLQSFSSSSLPSGVIATCYVMPKTTYDGSSSIEFYVIAPETTNYGAYYQQINPTP